MLKFIMFFLLSSFTFATNNLSITQLDTKKKDNVVYASQNSLNKIGFNIEKKGNAFILNTDIGKFKLEDTKIYANNENYSFVSKPFTENNKNYLPLNIVLELEGYTLQGDKIIKANEPKSPKVKPLKIISLSPGISEKIFALGGGEALVGRTKFCVYPEEIKKVDIVGTMLEPNLEIIVNKEPNLVIAETHFKESIMKNIQDLGIQVLKFETPKNIHEIYESILDIGVAIGHHKEARALNASLKDKVAFTENLTKNAKKPTVYYIVGTGKAEYTPGKDTFIDSLITLAGGENIAKDNPGWSYSLETLITKDPEIIFGGKFNTDIMKTNKNYSSLSAIKNNKIYTVESVDVFQLPGPRAITTGTYEMIKLFHPELAKQYKDTILK